MKKKILFGLFFVLVALLFVSCDKTVCIYSEDEVEVWYAKSKKDLCKLLNVSQKELDLAEKNYSDKRYWKKNLDELCENFDSAVLKYKEKGNRNFYKSNPYLSELEISEDDFVKNSMSEIKWPDGYYCCLKVKTAAWIDIYLYDMDVPDDCNALVEILNVKFDRKVGVMQTNEYLKDGYAFYLTK